MIRRHVVRFAVLVPLLFVVCATGYWCWDHRGYWFCDNFREVEAGRIYAGAYQYPIPLRRIIDRYKIKTVLSLRVGDDAFESEEREVLAARGVQFREVVIPYEVPDEERIDRIEEAIEIVTAPENHPVFIHCWAGCHRTGAVVAIYRVSRCGWTEQAALDELIEWGGAALGTQWPTRVLNTYCSRNAERLAGHSSANPDDRGQTLVFVEQKDAGENKSSRGSPALPFAETSRRALHTPQARGERPQVHEDE